MEAVNMAQWAPISSKKADVKDMWAMLQNQFVNDYNKKQGDLTEFDCPVCLNRGDIAYFENGYPGNKECECMSKRRNIRRLKESGLAETVERCTFDKYKIKTPWQKSIHDRAKAFADNPTRLFFIGGQVGAGKTHICTAISKELIDKGLRLKYMLWSSESAKIKFDMQNYDTNIQAICEYPVLYIDDLFKTTNGNKPSDVEVRMAFDIINYRYNNAKLITILSSEKSIQQITEIDQAVGSRIFEIGQEYVLNIPQDRAKNQRLGG